jgi:hypothetical protein
MSEWPRSEKNLPSKDLQSNVFIFLAIDSLTKLPFSDNEFPFLSKLNCALWSQESNWPRSFEICTPLTKRTSVLFPALLKTEAPAPPLFMLAWKSIWSQQKVDNDRLLISNMEERCLHFMILNTHPFHDLTICFHLWNISNDQITLKSPKRVSLLVINFYNSI